ncbi:unnamed protein product [Lepidochelys olivacea]
MPLDRDIAHPSLEEEKRKHKKKRLVQSPNSYFMDVKCPVDATRSPQCSAMLRQWFCALGAQLCCASLLEERPGLQKAAHLEESNIECSLCQHDSRYMLLEALSVQKRRLI